MEREKVWEREKERERERGGERERCGDERASERDRERDRQTAERQHTSAYVRQASHACLHSELSRRVSKMKEYSHALHAATCGYMRLHAEVFKA